MQKMLKHLPGRMRKWAAGQLGSRDAAEDEPPRRWCSEVEELRAALDSMMDVEPDDLATIAHHYDVYA